MKNTKRGRPRKEEGKKQKQITSVMFYAEQELITDEAKLALFNNGAYRKKCRELSEYCKAFLKEYAEKQKANA